MLSGECRGLVVAEDSRGFNGGSRGRIEAERTKHTLREVEASAKLNTAENWAVFASGSVKKGILSLQREIVLEGWRNKLKIRPGGFWRSHYKVKKQSNNKRSNNELH